MRSTLNHSSANRRPRRLRRLSVVLALSAAAVLSFAAVSAAQQAEGSGTAATPAPVVSPPTELPVPVDGERPHLIVATKPFAPFVFVEGGEFSGFSIDLWDLIADELGVTYEWYGTESVPDLLNAVRNGPAQVAIAGITITAERENTLDFTHPFFQSGLQVMISTTGSGGIGTLLATIFSPRFIKLIILVIGILLAAAHVLWVFERRKNPDMFPGGYIRGIWEAFWWSAVTITTVGYGDKTPSSVGGRITAIIWMFAGLFFLGYFTASIATVLTVERLEGNISGPQDLPGRRVGTVRGTTAAEYLYRNAVNVVEYDDIEEAYTALNNDVLEAVVYDSPALRYYSTRRGQGRTRVVGQMFVEQPYGIALQTGSPWREPIIRVLLEIRESGAYQDLYSEYFGE